MFDSYKIEKEIFKLKPDDTVSLYILICDDIMENIAVRKLKGRPSSTGLSVWINYESDNDLQGYTGKDFQIRNFGKVMQGRGYSDHSRIVYVKNKESVKGGLDALKEDFNKRIANLKEEIARYKLDIDKVNQISDTKLTLLVGGLILPQEI